MLSSVQMVILVVTVIFSGALCAVLLNLLNNHTKKKDMNFYCEDFSNHVTYKRMKNTDVYLDDIIYNFQLIIY